MPPNDIARPGVEVASQRARNSPFLVHFLDALVGRCRFGVGDKARPPRLVELVGLALVLPVPALGSGMVGPDRCAVDGVQYAAVFGRKPQVVE